METHQQESTTLEQDAETSERAAGMAVANGARPREPGSGATAARGRRHKPIIELPAFVWSSAAIVRRARDLRALWFDGRIDPAFREEIMVAVAGANSSRHCSFAHREWALAEGLPKTDLAALERLQADSFDARTWAAIAWARAAAGSDFADVPDAIEADFRRQFSDQEQTDIELVAHTMTWMNQTSNTVDAAWARLHGTPVPRSGALGELAALVMYAAITPVVIVVLSTKQRRNPISLIANVPAFFREFDARGQ